MHIVKDLQCNYVPIIDCYISVSLREVSTSKNSQ